MSCGRRRVGRSGGSVLGVSVPYAYWSMPSVVSWIELSGSVSESTRGGRLAPFVVSAAGLKT